MWWSGERVAEEAEDDDEEARWWNMRFCKALPPAILPRFIIMLRSVNNLLFDMPFLNKNNATLTKFQNFLAMMIGRFCSIL